MASIIEGRMDVLVPASLLETAELIPSAKVVWVGLALDAAEEGRPPPTYTVLAERLGLCRQTVSKAVARLRALGWYSDEGGANARPARATGKQTKVVAELILETSLSVAARLTYMQIQLEVELQRQLRTHQQATTGSRAKGLVLRFASLGKTLGRGPKALRNAVRELVQAQWLSFEQTNRVAPISVTPDNPIREYWKRWTESARKRLSRAEFVAEAIMQEELTVLVDTLHFEDNARPGFMVNPRTGERLELDRHYGKHDVGIECNGKQHYHATELYSEETVAKQRERDAIKRDLCAQNGVTLVVVRVEDLSMDKLREKVRGLLPLRKLAGAQEAIRFLEGVCAAYQRKVRQVTACQ